MSKISFISNKKAIAHIEVIVSFVIFIGFLIFLFAILNPIKEIKIDESLFEAVKYKITEYENLKSDISYVSIMLEDSPEENCFEIEKINDMECSSDAKFRAKDENNQQVQITPSGNYIKINDDNEFYTIFCSKVLDENSFKGNCEEIDDEDYVLGIIQKEELISVKQLKDLINSINNDVEYETIKQSLGIPNNNDFGLRIRDGKNILKYDNIEFEAIKRAPGAAKVSSKSYPMKIVYPDATFKTIIMDILIW